MAPVILLARYRDMSGRAKMARLFGIFMIRMGCLDPLAPPFPRVLGSPYAAR